MSKSFTINDIDEQVRSKVYSQDYSENLVIEGVKLVELSPHVSEEGDFSEILRIRDNGEAEEFPGFKIAQVNRTLLYASAVKAWHLHLTHDEIWYVMPNDQVFVGLWDVRTNSKTKGIVIRIVLGGAKRLLFIPKGVAHGSANFSGKPVQMFYFVNERFDIKNPDEKRLSWDSQGSDFWTPKRD